MWICWFRSASSLEALHTSTETQISEHLPHKGKQQSLDATQCVSCEENNAKRSNDFRTRVEGPLGYPCHFFLILGDTVVTDSKQDKRAQLDRTVSRAFAT